MKAIKRVNNHSQNIIVRLTRALIVVGLVGCVGSGFAQTLSIQSGSSIDVAQPAQPDSIVQIAAESQGLSQIAPEDLPIIGGTFWWVMPGGAAVPAPCAPLDLSGAIYQIAQGQFLVDETGGQVVANTLRFGLQAQSTSSTVASEVASQADAVVNLITQVQTATANQQMRATMQAMGMDVPSPGDGGSDGGTNSYTSNGSSYVLPDYGTNLWIAQVGISSGYLVGVASNSIAGTYYEIQSCENLLGGWSSEGVPVYGSETTNWTPFSVAMNGRTNLFLRIRSWADSTESGIPDWWWLQYFGSVGGDPFAFDPSGDGFTLWQAFTEGLNPTVFNTPAAPQGLTAVYNPSNGIASVSWSPGPSSVTGYTIERTYYPPGNQSSQTATFNVSASSNSMTEQASFTPNSIVSDGPQIDVSYQIKAHYAGGDSPWSGTVWMGPSYPFGINIIFGSSNSAYLVVAPAGLPPGTTDIRLTRVDRYAEYYYGNASYDAAFDIPLSAVTNGLYQIPAAWEALPVDAYGQTNYSWWLETLANGYINSEVIPLGGPSLDSQASVLGAVRNFYDGRVQLKQNLIFLLREPNANGPFTCDGIGTMSATYAYAGFYDVTYPSGEPVNTLNVYRPFADNYLYRNFVFSTADVDVTGSMTTGVTSDGSLELNGTPTYQFQPPAGNWTTIPALLATNQTRWLVSYPISPWFNPGLETNNVYYDMAGIGITYTLDDNLGATYTMANNEQNFFGLRFQSVNLDYQSGDTGNLVTSTLSPTGSYGPLWENLNFYPETAQPKFQAVGYNFWNTYTDLLPGLGGFSPTYATHLLITPVGQTVIPYSSGFTMPIPGIQIAGYAKLAIQNGYSGVYAYLGQYFTNAYTIDTNGNVTTNLTGILSPYGNFFATEPGPVALVTMPDPDTGTQGTCTVYCVALQLDKNHDGNMDLSFSGADATSQTSPMEFWVNDDSDTMSYVGDPGEDTPALSTYQYDYNSTSIPSQRDLEDWARLWMCGLPALPANQGYTVTLSMWAQSGNPAINLVDAVETNGGIGYLTNANTAVAQTFDGSGGHRYKYPTVSPTSTLTLPANLFTNAGNKYFLFEGAGIGEGQLTMTISQNGNVFAQTSQWLDLHDIKDFYEQAEAVNVPSGKPPSSLVSQCSVVHTGLGMGNETKQVVVYVHGINRPPWGAQNEGETLFKRLYWSGYHGHFAEFRWPCAYLPPNSWWPYTFNESEFWAYKCAPAFKNYLSYLRNRSDLADYAVDILAHSQGNAVASEALVEGATFDNYILTQGAVPAQCYDGSAPTLPVLMAAEATTPTPFSASIGGYNLCWTNISGNMVNFFNTNDFALASGSYGPFDANWVVNQQQQKPESFAGGPSYIYYPSNQTSIAYFLLGIGNYTVTDWQESRSMVARSRTSAIGAQGPATGQTKQGIIGGSVDLFGEFQFGNTRPEHSAQFTRPIQTVWGYYDAVLSSFGIQHIAR